MIFATECRNTSFYPTAVVKVFGQNCFRTPYGSGSWWLWFSGADPSWAAKRFHQGSAKVPASFHQGSTSFVVLNLKRFCGRFTHHFFTLVSHFLNSFLYFSLTASRFGVFSHSKDLGAKLHVCLLGFFAATGFCILHLLYKMNVPCLSQRHH